MSREQRSRLTVLGAYVVLAVAASTIAVTGLAEDAEPAGDLVISGQVSERRS